MMHVRSTTRPVVCLLLAMVALAVPSPVPEPEPAPFESNLAAVLSSNLNLGCQHGCPGPSGAQQLNKNAALGSAVSPLSVFGGLVVASSVLAAL